MILFLFVLICTVTVPAEELLENINKKFREIDPLIEIHGFFFSVQVPSHLLKLGVLEGGFDLLEGLLVMFVKLVQELAALDSTQELIGELELLLPISKTVTYPVADGVKLLPFS